MLVPIQIGTHLLKSAWHKCQPMKLTGTLIQKKLQSVLSPHAAALSKLSLLVSPRPTSSANSTRPRMSNASTPISDIRNDIKIDSN